MRSFIPSKMVPIKPKDRSWFNETCRNAVRSREEAFRNWQSNRNADTERLRKMARRRCNAIRRRQKFLHEQAQRRKVLTYRKGSKNFWSFVKQLKNTASQSIPTLLSNDEIFTNPVDKANLFADLFALNSNLPDSSQPLPELERVSSTMPEIHFRTRVVKKVLLGLNVNKSAGPDGISAQVLKKCASSLARPLRNLFYRSYSSGVFPSAWKVAHVRPVPKKG